MGLLDKLKFKVKVTSDTVIGQNLDVDASDLDGEKVMMNLDKGQYFMLNEVGSRIWDLIEAPKSVSGVIEYLLKEYDIDENTCKTTVIEYIEKLVEAEIVVVNR